MTEEDGLLLDQSNNIKIQHSNPNDDLSYSQISCLVVLCQSRCARNTFVVKRLRSKKDILRSSWKSFLVLCCTASGLTVPLKPVTSAFRWANLIVRGCRVSVFLLAWVKFYLFFLVYAGVKHANVNTITT